jgi:ribosomal-protein-alanine N-acetyltransferase
MNPVIIQTKRLILRPFEVTDSAAVLALSTDEAVTRYTLDPMKVVTEQDALSIITDVFHADYKQYGYGRLAVIYKPDNKLIGCCGLKYLPEYSQPGIGYRFLSQYWGMGIATESALAVMKYARETLKLDNIFGLVVPDNTASAKVLEKLGLYFQKEVVEDGLLLHWYQ